VGKVCLRSPKLTSAATLIIKWQQSSPQTQHCSALKAEKDQFPCLGDFQTNSNGLGLACLL